jgi:calcineurin-like phosphoesterase family protein
MCRVWFTADLHIGHLPIAHLRGFSGSGNHDATLARYWDTAVAPEDSVWVLGDISAGGNAAQAAALEWIRLRPGTKHLVSGNHDGIHPMNRDSHRHFGKYAEAFSSVQTCGYRRMSVSGESRRVVLSHFPYHSDFEGERRFDQWRLRDENRPVLHGHTHSSNQVTRSPSGTLQIHVGLDAWGMKLVPAEAVSALLEEEIHAR